MNKEMVAAVINYAETQEFGYPEFGILAGELADCVHAAKTEWVYTTTRACAALFKWQAYQFNGEWDQKALTETINWLRQKVLVTDWEKYSPRKTGKPREAKLKGPEYDTERFLNLEP
jgi:hypothetical protein